jgi:transposase
VAPLKSADILFKKLRRLTMRTMEQHDNELVFDKKVYVGIDVHKESWHVTIRTLGEEVFNGRIPGNYASLRKVLDRYRGNSVKVAYEAGPFGFWLYDKLTEDGIETLVVPPSTIPVESGNKVKTDKRDSRKLAILLERNMLKRTYVLSEEEREHRDLLRTRRQIVDHRNDVARQIKSKILFYGITVPFSPKTRLTHRYIAWLKTLAFGTPYMKESLDLLIQLYEYLTRQIVQINRKVVALCREKKYHERIKLLCTAPGIGKLTAIELLVELQDMARFKSASQLASYIGLTPAEYSTGEKTRQGRITRCGNKRVRTYLVESTWILITKDPWIRAKYLKLKAIRGGKRAVVAIARRFIIRLRRMLLDNVPYNATCALAA